MSDKQQILENKKSTIHLLRDRNDIDDLTKVVLTEYHEALYTIDVVKRECISRMGEVIKSRLAEVSCIGDVGAIYTLLEVMPEGDAKYKLMQQTHGAMRMLDDFPRVGD